MRIGKAALLKKRLMGAPAGQERGRNCWTSDQGYQWSRTSSGRASVVRLPMDLPNRQFPSRARRRAGCGSARRGRARSRSRTGPGSRSRRSAQAGRPCAAPAWSAARRPPASAGPRASRVRIRYCSVSPESTMSSTISTSRPSIGASRSLRIRTTPDGVGRRAVGGDGHEVDLARDVEVARIRSDEEEHRALEHADQQQVLARVVARDLRRQLADPVLEVVGLDEDLADCSRRASVAGTAQCLRRRTSVQVSRTRREWPP